MMHIVPTVTRDVLYAVAGGRYGDRQAAIIDAIARTAGPVFARCGITTPLRVAHLLGQMSHESDRFRTTVEYASGDAYDTRVDLGNTPEVDGDGRRYRGRGLIMLTGRTNYRRAGEALGIDLVGRPEQAAEPVLSLRIACWYWQTRDLSPLADADDIRTITQRINGGFNGLADREAAVGRAKVALVQQRLRALGYDPGPVDGRQGLRTAAGIERFQAAAGLTVDGMASPRTQAALWAVDAPSCPAADAGAAPSPMADIAIAPAPPPAPRPLHKTSTGRTGAAGLLAATGALVTAAADNAEAVLGAATSPPARALIGAAPWAGGALALLAVTAIGLLLARKRKMEKADTA